jgi:hypothetical protein
VPTASAGWKHIPGACLNATSINSPKWVVFNAFKL